LCDDQPFELLAPPGAGRLDRFLADQLDELSRAKLQALIKAGEITVDGARVRPATRLQGGERVRVCLPPPEPSELVPEDIPLELLYQDADLVVLVKPAGMVVHPAKGHRSGTLVHGLLHALPELEGHRQGERPGIVHRLDKGTSGVLVVARHELALRRLQAAFAIHDIDREYLAVVHGEPRFLEGSIRSQLGRHPRERTRFASVEEGGKHAVTHWRRLASANGVSLMSYRLETGRTHQIRVHASEAGHPVVGDPLYTGCHNLPGALTAWRERLDHQLLHAVQLGFEHHISGQRVECRAPPPADFLAFCAEAGLEIPSR
jgi:23S rRNA pseudouridine1911/1915/1917 synthase